MRGMRIPPRRRPTRRVSRARGAALIDTAATVILGAIALLCAALLAPALWATLVESINSNACATIADARERAACIAASAHPAKGATAPAPGAAESNR